MDVIPPPSAPAPHDAGAPPAEVSAAADEPIAASSGPVTPREAWTEWQRLPPAAAIVRTIGGTITGLVVGMPASIFLTQPLRNWPLRILAVLLGVIAASSAGAWLGRQRWRRTFWRLDDRGFQVRRGWLWRAEVLVPRSRVQHLDIERGPLERRFGLATLVVHTAGSQTEALRQSGLADADAVAVRDALIPQARDDDAL